MSSPDQGLMRLGLLGAPGALSADYSDQTMLLRILLVLLAVQLADLLLLVGLSQSIGFWQTLAITLAAGLLGGRLARREGLRVWRGWSGAVQARRAPADGVMDGMLVLLGGALLVAPGLLTDVLGVALLVPMVRRPLVGLLRRRLQRELDGRPLARPGPISFPREHAGRSLHEDQPRSGPAVIDTTGVESHE
jgi:UPF0716 family protein affecting phage T7 exclusion